MISLTKCSIKFNQKGLYFLRKMIYNKNICLRVAEKKQLIARGEAVLQILTGKPVLNDIAFGKLFIYKKNRGNVKKYHIDDAKAEIFRFFEAKEMSVKQLEELYQKAIAEIGENDAMIFYIHRMMLEDVDFCDSVKNIIESQKLNAEAAVALTCANLSAMFSVMEDVYMRERAADIKDISERVILNLSHTDPKMQSFSEPVILAADDLAPSETMQLDKSKILAFVTENGAVTSHTAILAKNMNIPAIIAVKGILNPDFDGREVIVDGISGNIIIDPDSETKKKMSEKKAEEEEQKKLLNRLKGRESVTADGKKIRLYANINSAEDLESVIQNDAEGIGLFRSEFLYLSSNGYPDEETQFESYRRVAEKMPEKRVIIRTFDIGADKKIGYLDMPEERNPALGFRAVRMYLKRPEIFKTHIRAIMRASAYGRIAVMIPMVISADEVRRVKLIIGEVKRELCAEGIPYSDDVEFGIMIETPAAALISAELAREADFLSIGTNDLTQYTLALDRQNGSVAELYNPHHPAVLRLIRLIASNAHKAGKWVGICGEAAADLSLTETFLALGIDELSVSPGMILPLRQKILETDISGVTAPVLTAVGD